MTDWSIDPYDPIPVDRPSLPRKIFVRAAPALAAFTFSALVALRLAGGLAEEAYAPAHEQAAQAPARALAAAAPSDKSPNSNPYGALFDPDGSLVGAPAIFADNDPVGPAFSPLQSEPLFTMVDPSPHVSSMDVAEADSTPSPREAADSIEVPLPPLRQDQLAEAQVGQPAVGAPVPPSRPSELTIQPRVEVAPPARTPENLSPRREMAHSTPRDRGQTTPLAQNDPRNFFEKVFGGQGGAGQDRPAPERRGQQLAYASPDAGGFNLFHGLTSGPSAVAPSGGGGTAVYDISAHTVYLPSGQALEAHSGLGPFIDNPDHVHRRMQGPTPPAVYNLTLRESLFHGVQALRLTPVAGNVYGRSGLLAHTFMLGQRGDSNGCVSFRNYRAFLQAYMNGEVRRLVVVARRG